jgi:ATP-dependent exoDNAse (exonuclease V) beta subunit
MSLNKYTIQTNFSIFAAASSGKTYTLSRCYINALLGFDYNRRKKLIQKISVNMLKNDLGDQYE